MRLKGSTDLDAIHIIKKAGGGLRESYLDEGFILDKKIGVNQPKVGPCARGSGARLRAMLTPRSLLHALRA